MEGFEKGEESFLVDVMICKGRGVGAEKSTRFGPWTALGYYDWMFEFGGVEGGIRTRKFDVEWIGDIGKLIGCVWGWGVGGVGVQVIGVDGVRSI